MSQLHEKESLVRRYTYLLIFDLMVIAGILSLFLPAYEKTRACSPDLFHVSLALMLYQVFSLVRNVLICGICYFTKRPEISSSIARVVLCLIECFAQGALIVWATIEVSTEEAVECANSDEAIGSVWKISVILIAVGFLVVFLQLVVTFIVCFIIVVFCCQYQRNNQQRLQQIQNRAPVLANALKSLNRKKFGDVQAKSGDVKECVICFEEFKKEEEIT